MTGFLRLSVLASLGVLACSSSPSDGTTPTPSTGGSGTQPTAGASSTAGTNGTGTSGVGTGGSGVGTGGGGTGAGGAAPQGGTNTGGAATTGGTSGAGGSATNGGAGGGSAGGSGDPLDTPPTHDLNVQAAPGLHMHTVAGMPAVFDNRLPKMMGKLIIDLDVDGGEIFDYGVKHGFHTLGPGMFHCGIAQTQKDYTALGRAFNGDCRLETFDGVDHDMGSSVEHAPASTDGANSVSARVKAALTSLQMQFPEEDWGYFLAADGSVRWSDVGITGYSHGASSSARWGKTVRLWRVVARSGPRDNICGILYKGKTCMEDVISAWLDDENKTPLDRVYGITGTTDSEYDDIIYAMERMKYLGTPVDIKSVQPPYNNSHRLIAQGVGHDPFKDKPYWPVMDYVWATDPANITYANAH